MLRSPQEMTQYHIDRLREAHDILHSLWADESTPTWNAAFTRPNLQEAKRLVSENIHLHMTSPVFDLPNGETA